MEQDATAGTAASPHARRGNRYDLAEWAGAFGDLGTLLPFVLAYIAVVKIDPLGMLLGFGLAMIAVGLCYKTPVPVQPMKAIGAVAATQAAQTVALTPQAVFVSGLATGLIWLALGATGLAQRLSRLIPRPIAIGIVLGLGFAFMLKGIEMMAGGWLVAGIGLALALALLTNRHVPAMLVLLAFGAAAALVADPGLVNDLAEVKAQFRLPSFALGAVSWTDALAGVVFLALPQLPLTFGNAIVAIKEENNRLFPQRPTSERALSLSTGLMNVFGSTLGAVPMCHGAGGMAGHYRFGARTGGAVVILGALLCAAALFFSESIVTLLRIFPLPVLGVVLFLTGAQLALGSCDFSKNKHERFATLVTAGCSVWNVGLGFVLGWILLAALRRGYVKL
ncbi:MAG TPA: putative sulfate/molybdate transporter [Burkholderiales bacterium]|nr:putative sulfate/molybdate transporter [Burkholderiales bacterium]